MTGESVTRKDQTSGQQLAREYPLDGYEALGRVVFDVTLATRGRLRAAHRRRSELRLLEAVLALPVHDAAARRPAR